MDKLLKSLTLLLLMLTANSAFAALMSTSVTPVANNVGGYTMTAFDVPTPDGSSASSASSSVGNVSFTDINGMLIPMTVGNAATDTNDDWWNGANDEFYYADFDTNWVELIMPTGTLAFALTIDASVNANAWIIGVADDGSAVDTAGNLFSLQMDGSFNPTPAFNIPLSATGPAQSYGFYADNSSGSCNTISKVVVDPYYWGMGDFSINVDKNACQVPEPSILVLFAVGLFGLGFARRRMHG